MKTGRGRAAVNPIPRKRETVGIHATFRFGEWEGAARADEPEDEPILQRISFREGRRSRPV